jgi:hypothetical protein
MNFLHIIEDDKFVKSCEETFNIESHQNFFLKKGNVSDSYILLNKIDVVFIHYLSLDDANFILNCKLKIKFVWFFWGADGFVFGKYYNRFLLKKTRIVRLKNEFSKSMKEGIKCLTKTIFPLLIDKGSISKIFKSAINRFDVVVPVMPLDYNMLRTDYGFTSKMVHLNYLTPFFFDNVEVNSPKFKSGNNIMLGNSASYTNNHIELIDVLYKVGFGRQVIIPLNYGDKKYSSIVSNYASNKLKENAVILNDFLEYNEYCSIVDSCGVLIMNHIRQQAVGNVLLGLLTGKTIYLRKESSVYEYLTSKGFLIKKIEDIDFEGIVMLKESELIENYHLAFRFFGKQAVKNNINNLIEILKNDFLRETD